MSGKLREFGKTLEQIWSMKEVWKRGDIFKNIVVGFNVDRNIS